MQLKKNSNQSYQDGNKLSYLVYTPIIISEQQYNSDNGKVVVEVSEDDDANIREDFNHTSSSSSCPLLGDTEDDHDNDKCDRLIRQNNNCSSSTVFGTRFRKIMGIISGCALLVATLFLTMSHIIHVSQCCNSNLSRIHLPFTGKNESSIASPPLPPPPNFDSDKPSTVEKIRHKMMSVSLKYIVDFILRSENFHFSCPPPQKNTTTFHPDQLDCQKYYVCDENGKLMPKFCENGHGFDNVTMSCVVSTTVQRCSDVGIFRGFNCSYIGLHPFHGDCNRFVICTQEKVAYVANCNGGDFFDPDLLICLSSRESEC